MDDNFLFRIRTDSMKNCQRVPNLINRPEDTRLSQQHESTREVTSQNED